MDSPLQGKFLVASHLLGDPNFACAVVLLVTHDDGGAMGLIINRPLSMTVAEAWKQVSEIPYQNDALIHQGGPCEGMLMVLHAQEELAQATVLPGLYLSTDAESVRKLVELDEGPMKFVVGYAGWSPGQLEDEIREGAWLLADAPSSDIYQTPDDPWARLTRAVTRTAGIPNIDPRRIPPDPSVN